MSLMRIKDYFVDRFYGTKASETTTKATIGSELSLKEVMTKLEPIFVKFQSLLIWDKPYLSAIAFLLFNCIYWLFVCLNRLRFYSLLAIILFCIHFFKLWSQYIWPEIRVPPNESTDTEGWIPVHPQVLSAPEINYYINELCVMSNALIVWFVKLRREKPLKFLITTSSILLMTAIIGKLVPGVAIVYSVMLALALGPGVVLYVFPEGLYELLRDFFIQTPNTSEEEGKVEQKDSPDDITPKQRLSESALHQYLKSTEFKDFELNPFESEFKSNDSSLQLLSDTLLDTTLDRELGIEVQLTDDDIKLDTQSVHSNSSRSSRSSSSAIRFISSHFSRNSSSENIEDDFELISDSELLLDSTKASKTKRQTKK